MNVKPLSAVAYKKMSSEERRDSLINNKRSSLKRHAPAAVRMTADGRWNGHGRIDLANGSKDTTVLVAGWRVGSNIKKNLSIQETASPHTSESLVRTSESTAMVPSTSPTRTVSGS